MAEKKGCCKICTYIYVQKKRYMFTSTFGPVDPPGGRKFENFFFGISKYFLKGQIQKNNQGFYPFPKHALEHLQCYVKRKNAKNVISIFLFLSKYYNIKTVIFHVSVHVYVCTCIHNIFIKSYICKSSYTRYTWKYRFGEVTGPIMLFFHFLLSTKTFSKSIV